MELKMVETFAERIKAYRDMHRMTLADLEKRTGIPATTLNRYELQQRVPKIDMATEIAQKLGVNPMWLMGYDAPMTTRTVKGVRIPVLGEVHAGMPIDAIQDILDYEEITPQMAASGEFFALRIKGDCMEPKISDGDVIIVRCQQDADSGDIVVAAINGDEAVCRKLMKYAEENGIALIPLNPAYAPIRYSAEEVRTIPVTIIGKAVELRSKL